MPYSDADLERAITHARSWRGALRALGLKPTSAGSMRSARRRADRLGISYAHFTGQRSWSRDDLAEAVAQSRSWAETLRHLDLTGGYLVNDLRSRAQRFGIDCTHLERTRLGPDGQFTREGDTANLRSAASCLAAAWFQLRGYSVSWPLEPARYDLLVEAQGNAWRVQVKTTVAVGSTRGSVSLSTSRREGRETYRVDEIDYFFIINFMLDAYLIPVQAVIGKYSIMLSAHSAFRVSTAGDWLGASHISDFSSRAP